MGNYHKNDQQHQQNVDQWNDIDVRENTAIAPPKEMPMSHLAFAARPTDRTGGCDCVYPRERTLHTLRNSY